MLRRRVGKDGGGDEPATDADSTAAATLRALELENRELKEKIQRLQLDGPGKKDKDAGEKDFGEYERNRSRRIMFLVTTIIAFVLHTLLSSQHGEMVVKQINEQFIDPILNDTVYKVLPPQAVLDGALGRMMKEEGFRAKYPIVIVPGFTSSGLELWHAAAGCESSGSFRARVWGRLAMSANMLKLDCWMRHLQMSPETGLDPPGVRVRAVEGFEGAADFMEVYWVWGIILQNLMEVGYDSSNMAMMSYDWRMSAGNMEIRDGYLRSIKARIESFNARFGRKVVVMSHSFGGNVFHYFLKWVESEKGGNGGKDWVDRHIHLWNNVAGALLGIPKAAAAILSGEMKDTSALGPLNYFLDTSKSLSRARRVEVFRTWGSLYSMLPKGGDFVLGDGTGAPDDIAKPTEAAVSENDTAGGQAEEEAPSECEPSVEGRSCPTFGQVIQFAPREENAGTANLTVPDFIELVRALDPVVENALKNYSFGYAKDPRGSEYDQPKFWTNPLESALPNAPSMKINCLYGVGKPTERAYAYQVVATDKDATDEDKALADKVPYAIDYNVKTDGWQTGVLFSDGDGTVTLTSMAYMCHKGWDETHNPGGIQIVAREYQHNPQAVYLRGGETSGDHLDVLGNLELNRDLVATACGKAVTPRVVSAIKTIAEDIHKRRYGS